MAANASHLLAVAAGGAVGASLRYLVSVAWLGIPVMPAWPWATFFVNVAGSLVFGFLAVMLAVASAANEQLRFALMTGLLGAFTTYSTFAFDSVVLWRAGEHLRAVLNVSLSLGLGFAAVALGIWLAGHGRS